MSGKLTDVFGAVSSLSNGLSNKAAGVVASLSIELRLPAEVRPDNTTGAEPATVTVFVSGGGIPLSGHPVVFSCGAIATSGGHIHDGPNRPLGRFSVESGTTDQNGIFSTQYTPSEFGGSETITVRSRTLPDLQVTRILNVRVPGLELLPTSDQDYIQIGGTNEHPGPNDHGYASEPNTNHWGKRELIEAIENLAYVNNASYPDLLLHFNDMSLPSGGKFDIDGSWGGSHDEHREGINVDLRARNLGIEGTPGQPAGPQEDNGFGTGSGIFLEIRLMKKVTELQTGTGI